MDPMQRYRDILAAKGRRLTAHAAVVADMAFSLLGTFDGEEVVARLRAQVSRATVYRTLASLMESGLVRQVLFNGRQVFVAAAAPDSEGRA